MTTIAITFCNDFTLNFKVTDTNIAKRWVEALREAQAFPYPIDDPRRFYGFCPMLAEQEIAWNRINNTIDTINAHEHLIDRKPKDVTDQDTLNYLHHIFEVYHGLLDEQTHPYYVAAPDNVKKALADLNTDVHRCESSVRRQSKRVVLTWYGLPKTRQYEAEDFELITNQYKFGSIYLNYVEIGKSLWDLHMDKDEYIAPEAFRPLDKFSADIAILFSDIDLWKARVARSEMWQYYVEHEKEFTDLGYGRQSGKLDRLEPGLIPVAELDSELSQEEIMRELFTRQEVSNVQIIDERKT